MALKFEYAKAELPAGAMGSMIPSFLPQSGLSATASYDFSVICGEGDTLSQLKRFRSICVRSYLLRSLARMYRLSSTVGGASHEVVVDSCICMSASKATFYQCRKARDKTKPVPVSDCESSSSSNLILATASCCPSR